MASWCSPYALLSAEIAGSVGKNSWLPHTDDQRLCSWRRRTGHTRIGDSACWKASAIREKCISAPERPDCTTVHSLSDGTLLPHSCIKSAVAHLTAVTAPSCLPAAAEVLNSGRAASLPITLCTSMLPLCSPSARMFACYGWKSRLMTPAGTHVSHDMQCTSRKSALQGAYSSYSACWRSCSTGLVFIQDGGLPKKHEFL